MSLCSFTQAFTGSADDLFAKLKSEVEKNNGTITGDASAGTFTIPALLSTLAGAYTITGQVIKIDISKKPPLIGCSAIGKFIAENIT